MVVDPGEIRNLLFAFFFAAMVIAWGVLYAVLITLARRTGRADLRVGAAFSYVMLGATIAALAWAANLTGPWLALVGLMLVGYFLMPRMILRLCEATHAHLAHAEEEGPGDGK